MNRQLNTLDAGDMAPNEPMLRTYASACADLKAAVSNWRTLTTQDLAGLNAMLTKSNLKSIPAPSSALAIPNCATN